MRMRDEMLIRRQRGDGSGMTHSPVLIPGLLRIRCRGGNSLSTSNIHLDQKSRMSSQDGEGKERAKRRKIAVACDECRAKKVRCDGVQPGRCPKHRIRDASRTD